MHYFINSNKAKFLSSPKRKNTDKNVPIHKPPPPPTDNHNADFMAVPPPSLHNLPIEVLSNEMKINKHIGNNNENDENDETKTNNDDNDIIIDNQEDEDEDDIDENYKPSIHAKKRLLLELEKFFMDKPPQAHKPRVHFHCNRKKFINDMESRFNRYGNINSSTGSSIQDNSSNP